MDKLDRYNTLGPKNKISTIENQPRSIIGTEPRN